MENQTQEQLLTWINTSLEAISINLEVLRKSEDKETVRKIEERINDWFFDLEMGIQKTPKIHLNLDYKPDIQFICSEENKKEEKAYIYLTGHENERVYIGGDTCYEVSKRLPGKFKFDEAQEIAEMFDLLFDEKGWRLPNKNELDLIYDNLKCSGQIIDTDWYWSSSSNNIYAWKQRFSDGIKSFGDKCALSSIRAVRPFKITS